MGFWAWALAALLSIERTSAAFKSCHPEGARVNWSERFSHRPNDVHIPHLLVIERSGDTRGNEADGWELLHTVIVWAA